VFVRWADGSTASSRSLTASPGATYAIVMAVQHALIRTVSGSGSVSGSDGFQASGASVQLTATPQSGHQFTGWAGSANGTANPLTLVMDGPKSVVAQFTPTSVSVRLESNIAGAQFTVSGSGCPAGTYTAPSSLSWLNGSGCVIAVASPSVERTRGGLLRLA
jgi:hypothetical protein